MNRGLCQGSCATVVATNGRSLTSGLPLCCAPRAGQSLFKQYKLVTANVSLGKAGSIATGLPRLTMKANRYYQANAYAVTLTA